MRNPPEILIVEDDATTAMLVEIQLKALGYRVMGTVASGEAALSLAALRRPDLVLMDVMLNGAMDGVEAAKQLLHSGHAMPVVFLTARNDHATMERIRSSMPFGCLIKPPGEEELGTAIGIALRGHELERQARRSQENLAAVLDVVADAVIALDSEGHVTFLNSAAERLCGRERYDAEGRLLDEILPPPLDEQGNPAGSWSRLLADGTVERTVTLHTKESIRVVRCAIAPTSGLGHRTASTVVMLHDLTTRTLDEADRRRLQDDVRRMSRALKVLSETSRVLQSATSETELFEEVCRLSVALGYRLAWIGMARHDGERTVEPLAQAGYRDRYLEEVHLTWGNEAGDEGPTGAAIRSGEVAIARDILADERFSDWRMEAAKRGYASGIALPLKSGDRVVGALTIYATESDAFGADEVQLLRELAQNLSYGLLALRGRSERQRVEQDLLKAEARYRALVEQIPIVTYVAAADDLGSRLYLSPQIATLTGFHPERWISNPAFFVNHLHPADRVRVLHELARCKDGAAPLAAEYRLLASDGASVWVRDEAKVVRDESGRPQFIHGVMMDITSRRLAEESLHHAHDALRALIKASPLAIFTLDISGCIGAVWNQAAEKLFGWSEAEVVGRPLPIVSPDKQSEARMFIARVLGGEIFTDVEIQRTHRDGSTIDLNMAAAPLTDPEGRITGVIAMLADISSRKRAEAALATAQRDATVGRMAAVVAHEVNNPLAAIKAWLGLLRSDLSQVPEARTNLDMIAEQVDRIARTVRNLLGFARQREGRDKRVPATALIRTVATLFQGRMRARGIEFTINVPDDLPAVHGDNDQLQEVLINLLENASQALSAGRHCIVRAAVRGQSLEIDVEDDGPGLGPEPERLFTPFYTTKVNGTGLGLSVARRICVAHGGRLTAENVDNGGARFRVVLPALMMVEAT
ncbi:MAG: PAS domain S-box protein [Planctomycetes bacterium]|nr:PAS domain S-box protein [Planctomycetota bacterium]